MDPLLFRNDIHKTVSKTKNLIDFPVDVLRSCEYSNYALIRDRFADEVGKIIKIIIRSVTFWIVTVLHWYVL